MVSEGPVPHTLVVVRHAKSDWSTGNPDHDRPLAPRGRRQAPESGAWLADHLGRIDVALVSTARRTRSTWELVAAQLADPPEPAFDPRIYAASGRTLLEVVRELPEAAGVAALVGHNPGVEDLVEELAGVWVPMPTSALAVIELTGSWAEAGDRDAVLRAAGRPPA